MKKYITKYNIIKFILLLLCVSFFYEKDSKGLRQLNHEIDSLSQRIVILKREEAIAKGVYTVIIK